MDQKMMTYLPSFIIRTSLVRGRCLLLSVPKNDLSRRWISNMRRNMDNARRQKDKNVVLYATAGVLVALGASYAAVPLYRIYCQSTGKGGRAVVDDNDKKVESMVPVKNRKIAVQFEADTSSRIAWDFKPTVPEIVITPGETALAFYTARNPTTKPVTGVATYSVMPYEAGLYLNKIQCFCFEEQRLNPKEEVDMPVFFYIDPQYAEDPRLENVDKIVLSYCFFESKDGLELPSLFNPDYPKPKHLVA